MAKRNRGRGGSGDSGGSGGSGDSSNRDKQQDKGAPPNGQADAASEAMEVVKAQGSGGNPMAQPANPVYGRPTLGVQNTNWNDLENIGGRVWNPDNIPLSTYDLMRDTDETLLAAMEFTALAVKNKIGEYSHEDEEIQEFVRANLNRVPGGWKNRVGELLTTGNWSGSSVTEIVWDLVADFRVKVEAEQPPKERDEFNSDPKPIAKQSKVISYGPSIVLHNLQTLRPKTVTYVLHMDHSKDHGEVKEVIQNLWTGYESQPLKRNKMLHYVHRGEHGNPYGKSRLRPCYIRWWHKDILEKAWGRTCERYASPIIVGETEQINKPVTDQYGNTVTRGQALLRVLEDLADNSVIVKEPDQIIEILVSSKAVGKDFLDAIEYINRAMLRGLLYPSLIFDNTDVGSYSLGEGHQDILSLSLEELVENMQQLMVKQLVTPLIVYKFGEQEDYGEFSAITIKAEDLQKWAEIIERLTGVNAMDMGYLGDLNTTREKFGLEAMDEPFKREPAPGYDDQGNPLPVPAFDPITGKPTNPALGGNPALDKETSPRDNGKAGKGKPKPKPGKQDKLAKLARVEDEFERELREHFAREIAARRG